MPNVSETLRTAAEILRQNGIAEPRREAGSLLSLALREDRGFLIAHPEYSLTTEEANLFQTFLERRARHEPLQYIRGRQEFFGLDFTLTPDVLIPRPETELIVEAAIEILREKKTPLICEVGVGSGCISTAILHEIKNAAAIGLDISEKALEIARVNAENNKVADRIDLKISDVFEILNDEKFELIVSNPPYVPNEDFASLQTEVRAFEPRHALTDGKDGLSIIEKIISGTPRFLQPEGFLLMEIGYNQSPKVREMFDMNVWEKLEFLPDLQGIPRTVRARIK